MLSSVTLDDGASNLVDRSRSASVIAIVATIAMSIAAIAPAAMNQSGAREGVCGLSAEGELSR